MDLAAQTERVANAEAEAPALHDAERAVGPPDEGRVLVVPEWAKPAVVDHDLGPVEDLPKEPRNAPWAAIYSGYVSGMSPRQLAANYNVPLKLIKHRIRSEQWAFLAENLPAKTKPPPGAGFARETVAWQNREANYAMFELLRQGLSKRLTALANDELKIETVKATREGVQVVESEPTPRDLQQLASAAKTLAEGSYRALGDMTEHERKEGIGQSAGQAINIVIPNVVLAGQSGAGGPEGDVIEAGEVPSDLPEQVHSPIPDIVGWGQYEAQGGEGEDSNDESENSVPG